ncbi:MAG: hypothetical protein Kow00108_00460 [Calditrichia bacterium]
MKKIISLFFLLAIFSNIWGTVYYVSPAGVDSPGAGTSETPFRTLQYAFLQMSGSDTLYLKEGEYSGPGNMIDVYAGMDRQPPSGSPGAYTLISAEPGKHVWIDGGDAYTTFSLSNRSYIKFNHITWRNSGSANVISIHDDAGEVHHIILKNCGAIDPSDNKDSGPLALSGTNFRDAPDQRLTHDILIEDCWAAGTARLVLTVWRCENVVVRRFVGRWDSHTYFPGRPEGGSTSYESANVSFQNCIFIDGNQNLDNYGGYGSMGTAQHTDEFAIDGLEFLGNIMYNWYGGFILENDNGTTMRNVTIRNNVVWLQKREGKITFSIAGGNKINVLVENNTIASSVGDGVYTSSGSLSSNSVTFRSNLIYNNAGTALMGSPGLPADYLNVYGNGSVGNNPGPNSISADPQLKYILRIEDNSPCKGAGYNGSDIGANILFRYGTDGTFWGDPGYNSLTSIPLWPYPNEDIIQQDFRAVDNRGFCQDISLTNYIWNVLGNGCPVCNEITDIDAKIEKKKLGK